MTIFRAAPDVAGILCASNADGRVLDHRERSSELGVIFADGLGDDPPLAFVANSIHANQYDTAVVKPLPKLSRRVELIAGLIPFAAFGLRVFASCFIGVPADDPVRMVVAPLTDWVNGSSGTVPFQWVLDVTVAIGLVWLASIGNIPRRWRLATIWVMP